MSESSLTAETEAGRSRRPYLEADGARWNVWRSPASHFQKASDLIRYRILLRQVPRVARLVVDAGCGDGYLSAALEGRGQAAVSLDLSAQRLKKARAAGALARPVQADCCRIPLADQVAGAVVISEVLEHLQNPRAAVAEAARVLAPGGRLVLSVPSAQDAPDAVCPCCHHRFNAAGHLHHFKAADLVLMTALEGLDTEAVFTAGSPVTRYLLRRAPRLARATRLLDAIFRRLAHSDNLYLFLVCVRRAS